MGHRIFHAVAPLLLALWIIKPLWFGTKPG